MSSPQKSPEVLAVLPASAPFAFGCTPVLASSSLPGPVLSARESTDDTTAETIASLNTRARAALDSDNYTLACELIKQGANPIALLTHALTRPLIVRGRHDKNYELGRKLLDDQDIDYSPYFTTDIEHGKLLSFFPPTDMTSHTVTVFEQLLMLGYSHFLTTFIATGSPVSVVGQLIALLWVYDVPITPDMDIVPWLGLPPSINGRVALAIPVGHTVYTKIWPALLAKGYFARVAPEQIGATLIRFLGVCTPHELLVYLKYDSESTTAFQTFLNGWVILKYMRPYRWKDVYNDTRFDMALNLHLLLEQGLPVTSFDCNFPPQLADLPEVTALIFYFLFRKGWSLATISPAEQTKCGEFMWLLRARYESSWTDSGQQACYLFLIAYLFANGWSLKFTVLQGNSLITLKQAFEDLVIKNTISLYNSVQQMVRKHPSWNEVESADQSAVPQRDPIKYLTNVEQSNRLATLETNAKKILARTQGLNETCHITKLEEELLTCLPVSPVLPRGAKYERCGRYVTVVDPTDTAETPKFAGPLPAAASVAVPLSRTPVTTNAHVTISAAVSAVDTAVVVPVRTAAATEPPITAPDTVSTITTAAAESTISDPAADLVDTATVAGPAISPPDPVSAGTAADAAKPAIVGPEPAPPKAAALPFGAFAAKPVASSFGSVGPGSASPKAAALPFGAFAAKPGAPASGSALLPGAFPAGTAPAPTGFGSKVGMSLFGAAPASASPLGAVRTPASAAASAAAAAFAFGGAPAPVSGARLLSSYAPFKPLTTAVPLNGSSPVAVTPPGTPSSLTVLAGPQPATSPSELLSPPTPVSAPNLAETAAASPVVTTRGHVTPPRNDDTAITAGGPTTTNPDLDGAITRLRELRLAGTMSLRDLQTQYTSLTTAAQTAQSPDFFLEQGHFYYHCAHKQTMAFAQKQLYAKAIAAYEQAIIYDPLMDVIEEYEICLGRI